MPRRQTAIERGLQMYNTPFRDLPSLAIEFFRHCGPTLTCAEMSLRAFIVYAQCVEGLPCDDDLYRARRNDAQWFRSRNQLSDRFVPVE